MSMKLMRQSEALTLVLEEYFEHREGKGGGEMSRYSEDHKEAYEIILFLRENLRMMEKTIRERRLSCTYNLQALAREVSND